MFKKFIPFRSAIIALGLLVLLGALSFIIMQYFNHYPVQLAKFEVWLSHNRLNCLIWRLCVLAVFFVTWPAFIKHKARRHNWSQANIQRAIRLRYILVLVLLLLDVIFQWGTNYA